MKVRLDQHLVDTHLAADLEAARAMIGAGEIYVNDVLTDKAGSLIPSGATIRTKERCAYVSRGGVKLEKGLSSFQLDVRGRICLDIGASTGGFTDCLLQRGAKKVFAIDVAYGQLAWKLRQDPRVVVYERFNARKISAETVNHEAVDFAVIDVSFISLTKIIPPLLTVFPDQVHILALIKPQFELARADIAEGGVVTDNGLHRKAIEKIELFAAESALQSRGVTSSPLLGPKGNKEFLIYLTSP